MKPRIIPPVTAQSMLNLVSTLQDLGMPLVMPTQRIFQLVFTLLASVSYDEKTEGLDERLSAIFEANYYPEVAFRSLLNYVLFRCPRLAGHSHRDTLITTPKGRLYLARICGLLGVEDEVIKPFRDTLLWTLWLDFEPVGIYVLVSDDRQRFAFACDYDSLGTIAITREEANALIAPGSPQGWWTRHDNDTLEKTVTEALAALEYLHRG